MQKNWHNLTVENIFSQLKSSRQGLTEAESERRLKKHGLNELPQAKSYSKLVIFIEQFKSPLIYILFIAGIVTYVLGDYIDTSVIFGAVAVNVLIGFTQENKANQALVKLRKMVKPKAIVIREGNQKQIKAANLSVGDLIAVKSGDKIPADARLVSANNLKVNEAALTGEWLPASKHEETLGKKTPLADRDNMLYMGTIVESGLGQAMVVEIGTQTELGKIATLVTETSEDKTPFQKKLARFAKLLGLIFSSICLAIFISGTAAGRDVLMMFKTSVAIAVAAVPEGLPAAMTVILAVGMRRILKQKGLVRNLVATETLGSTSIICTDKTGTLTQAKMIVTNVLTGTKELLRSGKKFNQRLDSRSKESHILALKIAALCNEAFIENPDDAMEKWIIRGRATDKAMLLASIQAGLHKKDLEEQSPCIKVWPFNTDKKFIASLHSQEDNYAIYVSGAPENILDISKFIYNDISEEKLTQERQKELKEKYESLTKSGLRVVAVAYRNMPQNIIEKPNDKRYLEDLSLKEEFLNNFVFVGFIALKDPLRKEVKQAIANVHSAGIKTIIVTGDHCLTAKAIAAELNIPSEKENVIEGQDLDSMEDSEFDKRLKKIFVYARVEPKHKLRIIEAWQRKGEVVAMTGDGINDAPALKKADIGVALGSGTDVAKETSDLILLNDNFSIIVAAVEQGRVLLDNLKKVVVYLLSDSFAEIILVGGSLLMGLPLPLTAAQILWINLVNDSFPSLALAFEPKEKDVMQQKPPQKNTKLLDTKMKTIILIVGSITSLFLFTLFCWLLQKGSNEDYIRTMIFAGLGAGTLFYVFSTKSLRQPIWKIDIFSNKYLLAAVALGFLLLVSAIYVPFLQILLKTQPIVKWQDILIVLAIGMINLAAIEVTKWFFMHKTKLVKVKS